jgi:hypothetical protein
MTVRKVNDRQYVAKMPNVRAAPVLSHRPWPALTLLGPRLRTWRFGSSAPPT